MAEDPAQIDVGGQVRAQSDWRHLGGVSGGDGLEDAPGKTAEDLAGEQHLDVDGKEGDEDETDLDQSSCQRLLRDIASS